MRMRPRTLNLLDPYREALISRLRLRIDYLVCLDMLPREVPRSFGRIERPVEPTRAPVTPVFDDVTPYLRQSMPPSQVTIPDHESSWAQMSGAIESLQELGDTDDDLSTWEITRRSRAWRRNDLNIARSLFKVGALNGVYTVADHGRAFSMSVYTTSRVDMLPS